MPPPKQKPIAESGSRRPTRRAISVTAAFMSLSNRSGVFAAMADSAAITAASSGNAPVPPSSDSRSSASAEKPLAAKRPATLRMWSVRPRFSWMTSTPPFSRVAASAHAPIRTPFGPGNVIGSVAAGAHAVTRRSPWRWPWSRPRGSSRACARPPPRRSSPSPRSRSRRAARPPHRLPAGDDPVDVVLRDLFGQVPLELRHRVPPRGRWLDAAQRAR
jgi:hypothetical protein